MPLYDPPIRAALVGEVVADLLASDPNGFYVDEMGLCEHRARIDVAVFNGHFHGFEIKSDRDSFARLEGQASVYNAVLDRVTIVVGEKHRESVAARVDPWWGIIVARREGASVELDIVREAQDNHALDSEMLAHMLWRDEALAVLERLGKDRGVRSKSRYFVCKRLASVLSTAELSLEVRRTVKLRGDWRRG